VIGADVPGNAVLELEFGILVYPPRPEPEQAERKRRPARWRAVWYEDGERQQCESVSEEKLAAELEKVKMRLEADAPNMKLPGADLIAYYLNPDRLPPDRQWSRKHAHTQCRLCERFAAPVIAPVTCQDIKTQHMQRIVNTAPTAGEGARVAGMISALVGAGIEGGYLANPRLAKVHWQAAGRRASASPSPGSAARAPSGAGSSSVPARDPNTRCSRRRPSPTVASAASSRTLASTAPPKAPTAADTYGVISAASDATSPAIHPPTTPAASRLPEPQYFTLSGGRAADSPAD
jgi:hypothetical protein